MKKKTKITKRKKMIPTNIHWELATKNNMRKEKNTNIHVHIHFFYKQKHIFLEIRHYA